MLAHLDIQHHSPPGASIRMSYVEKLENAPATHRSL